MIKHLSKNTRASPIHGVLRRPQVAYRRGLKRPGGLRRRPILYLNLIFLIAALALGLAAPHTAQAEVWPHAGRVATAAETPVYTYEIVNVYPHDRQAFTQGLAFAGPQLYEGTGLWRQSSLRRVQLKSGAVLQQLELEPEYFGEGITIWGDEIIQLTWKAQTAFVYDIDTFELLRTYAYPTEGWGLTHDGKRLIMSDGTSTLYFRDPTTFAELEHIQVTDQGSPVQRLNELEYVQGEVFANVWLTDRIARIDPASGHVTGWIDLTGLLPDEDRDPPVNVLNGIAYMPNLDRLFVTGKLWPKLFEIELVPVRSHRQYLSWIER